MTLASRSSVWLHGAGLQGTTFNRLTEDCPQAIKLDLPGHGAAPRVNPPTVEAYAKAVAHHLSPRCVLIGHSLGAMVALEVAANRHLRDRQTIDALVLIETYSAAQGSALSRFALTLAQPFVERLPPALMGKMAGWGEAPATAAELRRGLAATSPGGLRDAMRAALSYSSNPRHDLASLDIPTLVVIGSRNRRTHGAARALREAIPNAALHTIEAGHMVYTDAPEALRSAIDGFLATPRLT